MSRTCLVLVACLALLGCEHDDASGVWHHTGWVECTGSLPDNQIRILETAMATVEPFELEQNGDRLTFNPSAQFDGINRATLNGSDILFDEAIGVTAECVEPCETGRPVEGLLGWGLVPEYSSYTLGRTGEFVDSDLIRLTDDWVMGPNNYKAMCSHDWMQEAVD